MDILHILLIATCIAIIYNYKNKKNKCTCYDDEEDSIFSTSISIDELKTDNTTLLGKDIVIFDNTYKILNSYDYNISLKSIRDDISDDELSKVYDWFEKVYRSDGAISRKVDCIKTLESDDGRLILYSCFPINITKCEDGFIEFDISIDYYDYS